MGNSLLNSLRRAENRHARTKNYARSYENTLNPVLDFFAKGGALRADPDRFFDLFSNAWRHDRTLALRCLFYLRDARGGAGERKTFRRTVNRASVEVPGFRSAIAGMLPHFAYYGRWDDILALYRRDDPDDGLWEIALSFIVDQLNSDRRSADNGGHVSLLAKWLPSLQAGRWPKKNGRRPRRPISAESLRKRAIARSIAKKMAPRAGRVESYRNYINVVRFVRSAIPMAESDLSQKRDLRYDKYTSGAHRLYRKAFKRIDPRGYAAFMDKVERGEVKMKATSLMPYQLVVAAIKQGKNRTIDAQWAQMVEDQKLAIAENAHRGIVVLDTSGSMRWPESKITDGLYAMDVGLSAALLMAEAMPGPFNGYFINFAVRAKLIEVRGSSLTEKARNAERATVNGSTNIESVFDLILTHAVQNSVPQSEMPTTVCIISDMQFNPQIVHGLTALQGIELKYMNAGYEMPTIVFWDVSSYGEDSPAEFDSRGVILVSGFTPDVFTAVAAAAEVPEPPTPLQAMLDVLEGDRYNSINLD